MTSSPRAPPPRMKAYTTKATIMGPSGCGKTSLGEALKGPADVRFDSPEDLRHHRRTAPTIGTDFVVFNAIVDDGAPLKGKKGRGGGGGEREGSIFKMQLWDTAGMEKYHSYAPNAIRNSSVIFLCFDVSDRKSYEDMQRVWLPMALGHRETVKTSSWCSIVLVFVATKTDLVQDRVVSKAEAFKLAEEQHALYFETTALDASTVHQAVTASAIHLYKIQVKEGTLDSLHSANSGFIVGSSARRNVVSVADGGATEKTSGTGCGSC